MSIVNSLDFAPDYRSRDFAILAKLAGMPGRKPTPLRTPPNRIRATREALGMTLEEVAKRAGLSYQRVQKYETGDRGLRVPELERIADALGVKAAALLNSTDPQRDRQEGRLLAMFRAASPEDRDRILRTTAALAHPARRAWPGGRGEVALRSDRLEEDDER